VRIVTLFQTVTPSRVSHHRLVWFLPWLVPSSMLKLVNDALIACANN
jgi:hypothetical protein